MLGGRKQQNQQGGKLEKDVKLCLFDHHSFDDSELCLRWFMLMAIRAIALISNASQMLPGREG